MVVYRDTHLSLKVIPHKIKRVLESGNRGKLNIRGRFVFASAMDNSSQDFV